MHPYMPVCYTLSRKTNALADAGAASGLGHPTSQGFGTPHDVLLL